MNKEQDSEKETSTSESRVDEEADKEDKEDNKGSELSDRDDVLIAVVDYDTKDATRILGKLEAAELDAERVGTIEELDVDKYDAIVIPGGNSVTPSMYGAEKDPRTKNTNLEKDEFQFEAVQMFIDAEKPILAICRGEQLVNNVLGGTTIQHMEGGWHRDYRPVKIAEGTWLYDLMGPEASTYQYHHQCVDKLGDGLYATQWDPETGNIEAYEHKTLPIYGLQWHPDSMEEDGTAVFAEFGKIVREDAKDRRDR